VGKGDLLINNPSMGFDLVIELIYRGRRTFKEETMRTMFIWNYRAFRRRENYPNFLAVALVVNAISDHFVLVWICGC